MSIELVFVGNIGKSQQVELDQAVASSSIDWKEHWPSYATANEANGHTNLEVAKEKVAVD